MNPRIYIYIYILYIVEKNNFIHGGESVVLQKKISYNMTSEF